ncbi:hypothetical protein LWI28_017995 [Acer negundo]|uniref:CCHC-type domain-containing protein n=1 Tax=Acer negundo TaxID=4023 RepID=A0AAD5J5F7_ACENE|nr:hypothetical protein LWI28_017995 [Acer negundo]
MGGSNSTPNIFSAPIQQSKAMRGFKCFNCGEVGHRQSKCKKLGKTVLFADMEEEEEVAIVGDKVQFDDDGMVNEDWVEGDIGPLLMVKPVGSRNLEDVKTESTSAVAQFIPYGIEEEFWNKRDATNAKNIFDSELQWAPQFE